ncbi:MAG: flagella basal body P-ring formation protein FlgA, partial [Paracoccaceae bacterium]|nr:flagella basal body P-ring formation protein FlgA [Paracoccaceae bacterium]
MRSLLLIIFTSFFSSMIAISYANAFNGALIHDLIVEKLNSHNLNARPAIDKARKFPSCPNQISVKSIFGSWKTVQVSCPETNWKIAVRTNIMQTKFTLNESVKGDKKSLKSYIALRASLNKGEVIEDSHLKYYASKKNIGGGVFYEKNHLIGRTLKRALSVGTIIRARHLNPNWVIEKGQLV